MACLHPQVITTEVLGKPYTHTVPCGKCIGCLSSRRQNWTFRLIMENLIAKDSYFITLTYDNEHLPCDYSVNKEDVQKFLKRLRKQISFRYFLVSEYGDNHNRCHYHFLLFSPDELKYIDCCQKVYNAWNKGNICVGEVTPASIAYCSKYSLKDHKNCGAYVSPDTGEIFHLKPTFSLMSRRPGIGYNFTQDSLYKSIVKSGQFEFIYDGQKYVIPRYYREKMFNDELTRKYYNYVTTYLEKSYKNDRQKFNQDWLFQERSKSAAGNKRRPSKRRF